MNPLPEDFVVCPVFSTNRPGAFAAVRPGSLAEQSLDRHLACEAQSVIASLRQPYHRALADEARIAGWLVAMVGREACGSDEQSFEAPARPVAWGVEACRARELHWHRHLNVDPAPLTSLIDRYDDALSSVVDFDLLALDPEAAMLKVRQLIDEGRVPALQGFVAAADGAMLAAREGVRRQIIDRLIEEVCLPPGADAIEVMAQQGLAMAWRVPR